METIIQTDEAIELYTAHPEIYDMDEKYIFGYGGRGGGKSKSFARFLVMYALEYPGLVELITRKAMPSLKITAMNDFLKVCEQLNVNGYIHESTPAYYQFANGSITHFLPLYLTDKDRNERLKSLDTNIIWFEEPPECNKKDITEILPNIRLPGIRKAFLSFNPPATSQHWIYKLYDFLFQQGWAAKVHFDIEDNPCLPDDVKNELMAYKTEDEGYYKRYALGLWGIDVVEDRIWHNITTGKLDITPDEWFMGVDFGWVHPSSCHLYARKENKIFVVDEIFGDHIKDKEFGEKIIEMLQDYHQDAFNIPAYADSEDGEGINDLQEAGVYVVPIKKGPGSVAESIKLVRKFQIIIDINKCPHAYEQLRAYQNKVDRAGNPMEDTPVKANNDACDDLRYAVSGSQNIKPQIWL